MRHAATFRLTSEAFCALFREGASHRFRVENGLPEDARLVGARYDGFTNTVEFAVEGGTLPALNEGDLAPCVQPTFRRINEDDGEPDKSAKLREWDRLGMAR